MRWISQIILLILLASGLYFWLFPIFNELWLQTRSTQQDATQARASSYFPFKDEQWLNFEIANQSKIFRFYFHAGVLSDQSPSTLQYQIQYQWLDADNQVLDEHYYHINTRPSPFLPGVSNSNLSYDQASLPLATRFYNDARLAPSLDQALYLSPIEQPNAQTLRFRVHSKDQAIKQIGVRSYIQHHRDPKDIDIAWQRMSRIQRENVSKASVYPSFLISDYERRNLLGSYWKPIGPLGVLEKDYRIETIYLRENTAPTLPLQSIVADGLFSSNQHWLTFKLSKPDGRYRIRWQAINKKNPTIPTHMQLRWQDISLKQERQWEVPVNHQEWQGVLSRGLIQVIPNSKGIFKLYIWEQEKWKDITPEKLRSRGYLCTATESLTFALAPGKKRQSIKVTAKGFHRSDLSPTLAPGQVIISTKRKDGLSLVQDKMTLPTTPNPYQHFNDASIISSQVYQAVYRYLDTPKNSDSLQIKCSQPSLISVSTRPWQHPISLQLPRDHNYWHSYPDREPSWYSLQPKHVQRRITNKQYYSLLWYFPPAESSALMASGEFDWQALQNVDESALEQTIFSNKKSDKPARMQTRSVSFEPVVNKQSLVFSGKSNQSILRPSAVYLRNNDFPQSIQVWVDNQLLLKTTVAGKSGKIRLPSVKAGPHKIEFRTKGDMINWYTNNTAQSNRSHLLRSAYALKADINPKDIEFSHNKTYSIHLIAPITGEGQQLSIWLFAPLSPNEFTCQIKAPIKRLDGSHTTHSFGNYKYSINEGEYPTSSILQRSSPQVHGPIPLLILLKSDLPPQTVKLTISCDQPGVLASAGIISIGLSESFQFKEQLNEQ